jgi:tRNA(Ile)-lysidine synthase
MMDGNWNALEHQVYRQIKGLQGQSFLLMLSGGADSVALLQFLMKFKEPLNLDVQILHCHHGPDTTHPEQQRFRDEALVFCHALAHKFQLPFHVMRSENEMSSEDEFRNFRKAAAVKIQSENQIRWVTWAHHQDDLLETQILRLIRGASPQAVFEPMSLQKSSDLRPLLQISRAQIVDYLKEQNLNWLEDPSNQDEKYLRNWLRHSWLPQLEEKCPGALKSFSRSLDLLRQSQIETFPEEIWVENGLSRPVFLTLSEVQKKQLIALYLRKLGQKEFTHNQIKEVLKHLDIPQLNHTFTSAHLEWHLSKELIYARPRFVVNAF